MKKERKKIRRYQYARRQSLISQGSSRVEVFFTIFSDVVKTIFLWVKNFGQFGIPGCRKSKSPSRAGSFRLKVNFEIYPIEYVTFLEHLLPPA